MTKRKFLFLLLFALNLLSCTQMPFSQVPEQADHDWPVAGLNEVGIDEDKLNQAIAHIENGTYQNIHAILVVKEGKLVFERYFRGYTWDYDSDQYHGDLIGFDSDTPHNLASVTKSVTSILVGIALDQGAIQSVNEEMFAFFPQYEYLSDPQKAPITLKHLLTMTSGLAWNGAETPLSDPQNDIVRMFNANDPVSYILSKPIVTPPGSTFHYSSGDTNLIGEAIQYAVGQRMDLFAEKVLFEPLGITNYEWLFVNADMVYASGNLKLRPRDMAKIGQLALNGGTWNGKRIVSEAWIEESTRQHITHSSTSGYSYQWWLKSYYSREGPIDAFYASGWGGQKIMVFPDLDMVVVFTGGNYASEDLSEELLTQYILPTVQQ